MKQEVRDLLVGVAKVDLMIGLTISVVIAIIFGGFIAIAFLAGIMMAFIALYINSIVYSGVFLNNKPKGITYSINFLKLILIAAMGLKFVSIPYAAIVYVLGYNAHFLALAFYWILFKKGSA